MSASTAIGQVSESLRNLLMGEMQLVPAVEVTILAPNEQNKDRCINLFLYQVQENASFKNADWQLKSGSADTLVPPPLSLNLFYLMTAYAANDAEMGNATAHAMLGEAMRVFNDYPDVPGTYLTDDLKTAREKIKIMLKPLDMEELARVWSTFSQPFRLSVLYEISVVQLEAKAPQERPLPRRVREIGVPGIRAPYSPPVVDEMTPQSGPPGTEITFHGQHLVGWNAYVRFMEDKILDKEDLTQDQFKATLPNKLSPGFQEIQVDISHLFRKTFFFEVT